jgi:peptidoglycan/LPS O-acetylase OafA/YrhL
MGLPKLIVLVLALLAAWCFYRWVNRAGRDLLRQRGAPRRTIDAEDLTACSVCGAFVAAGAPGCGRSDCPR